MYRIAMLIVGVMMFGACNQATKETGDAPVERPFRSTPATADAQPAEAAVEVPSLEGTKVSASSGVEVEVISVGTFDEQTKDLTGLVAVEGRVSEAFPDRGAFLLVDYDRMKGCATDCCPQAEVPVRIAIEEFEGELPAVNDVVVLVGDITVTETGYTLAVLEVRREGAAILSRSI